jgi:hypothetical protein
MDSTDLSTDDAEKYDAYRVTCAYFHSYNNCSIVFFTSFEEESSRSLCTESNPGAILLSFW